MRLVVGTLAVQRVLAITGIDRLLDTYPCVTAALTGPAGELRRNDQSQSGNVTAKADSDGGAA